MHPSDAQYPHERALLLGNAATLALFAGHHVYGAVLYATPWRHHAAFIALGVGVGLLAARAASHNHPGTTRGRLAAWTMVALTVAVPLLTVGLFEGLYNHVLKDVLFLAGAPHDLLVRLFPPPRYELPNDVLFEVSGVLQPVAAAFTAVALARFVRALRAGAAQGASVLDVGQ